MGVGVVVDVVVSACVGVGVEVICSNSIEDVSGSCEASGVDELEDSTGDVSGSCEASGVDELEDSTGDVSGSCEASGVDELEDSTGEVEIMDSALVCTVDGICIDVLELEDSKIVEVAAVVCDTVPSFDNMAVWYFVTFGSWCIDVVWSV